MLSTGCKDLRFQDQEVQALRNIFKACQRKKSPKYSNVEFWESLPAPDFRFNAAMCLLTICSAIS